MDIRLNAKLSAYGKIPTPVKPGCDVDEVTHEDIDSLFGKTVQSNKATSTIVTNTSTDVTHADIDSLFK